MESTKRLNNQLNIEQMPPEQVLEATQESLRIEVIFKKLRGGFFLVVGYLLSPLCWWNDLIFNLPVAYLFGYLCSLVSPDLLMPCSIIGYWLSNLVGILMMQVGAVDVLQGQSKERSLKKELLTGLITSTVYTLVIVGLVQFHILENPILLFSGR